MKLLLTSGGITNAAIVGALRELCGREFSELQLAFVPTAANILEEDKGWMLDDMARFRELHFGAFDIVDLAALPNATIFSRLEKAGVIVFGGGHTLYLLHWMRESGLARALPALLETRVYVGISAGSMVAGNMLTHEQLMTVYSEYPGEWKAEQGLGLVDFGFFPHLDSPDFPQVRKENIDLIRSHTSFPLYALNDQSALLVNNAQVEVIA